MKHFRLIRFALALIISTATIQLGAASSKNYSNNEGSEINQASKEVLVIESSRFTTPLAKKWATEYVKYNPNIEIVFSQDDQSSDADLSLVSATSNDGSEFTHTARFALLPVTNSENPFLNELSRKRLNNKTIRELFFDNYNFEDNNNSSEEPKYDITIYSGNNADSFAEAFASHFGYSKADLKGRKISGNDIFLINAVQKDNEGITFNNLSYIFDIETRNIKEGIALIPLDLKKEQWEVLDEANIDKTISLLEEETIPLIPIESIGFISENENEEAQKFIEWVLTEGQKFNREFGFLKSDYEQFANN